MLIVYTNDRLYAAFAISRWSPISRQISSAAS